MFRQAANLGSLRGESAKATDRRSLLEGLRRGGRFDPRLVVEQGVTARELECAVRASGPGLASNVASVAWWVEICFERLVRLPDQIHRWLEPHADPSPLARLGISGGNCKTTGDAWACQAGRRLGLRQGRLFLR